MIFTAELGTSDSMPGNIALGQSQSEGGGTGGRPPQASGTKTAPQASAHAPRPQGTASTPKPR